jgi:hypothetical protein
MKRIRCTLNWIDRGVLATLVFTGITQAEDLTTLTGRTLHEVSYSAPSADSVQVNSREGSERLYLFDLPAEIQRRFQFDPLAALRRLAAENRDLKAQLSATRGTDGVAPRKVMAASPAAAAAWAERPATPPPASLPPLARGARVDAFDLVHHYRADPGAAGARYRGRDFEIEGIVERVEATIVGRGVKVLLESPDHGIRVVVEWRVPEEYSKFYTKAEGRRLFGGSGGAHRLVLGAGDRVVFSVRGGAYDDAAVFLGRAQLATRSPAVP